MAKVALQQVVVCYIGLGANLGDREENIRRALELLRETPNVRVVRVSTLEETVPFGPVQPAYLNGVAAIETALEPLELLDRLQAIEARLGRARAERWGPRTIDLDILYYGNEQIAHPRLTVPHPEIYQRDFVQRELKEAGYHG
ncbi:MAG: 2-amino-4-hydroxy-6-hydroxymethyldihydropteridine diphosphokinase [Elusimicrobia bacterium RIFCSPLOWO2_01_FULL_59_12]|nr:MAG: 2-amino-4-hydroxy-6-hydroxymethyldihydropteridine diphosphokinase [Elusimicrobia bacterium RIFCSPLOWO2_01_FULL_59_12]